MSITKELREFADELDNKAAMKSEHGFSPVGMRLGRIANRIDEEHEREVTMARGEAVAELGNKVAREYVKLPVDADGEVIHVGDRLEGAHRLVADNEYLEIPLFAESLTLTPYGWRVVGSDPATLHHFKSTVEEVLLKMLEQAVGYSDAHTTVALGAVEEYADRIREAVHDEEDE